MLLQGIGTLIRDRGFLRFRVAVRIAVFRNAFHTFFRQPTNPILSFHFIFSSFLDVIRAQVIYISLIGPLFP